MAIHLSESPANTSNQQPSLLSDTDLFLFGEGTHYQLFDKLGAHYIAHEGVEGLYFAVWAPNAERVGVIGDFNGWSPDQNSLKSRANSGVWEGFIPGLSSGTRYKYHIVFTGARGFVDKADPFAFSSETQPGTASIACNLHYDWSDAEWLNSLQSFDFTKRPINIYEIHLGSWRRVPQEGNRFLTYRELAPMLADYLVKMNFTHVEFLPLMAHPFYGSWGYQTTSYFAPTGRYGSPQDLMFLIDHLHQHGIGVILDWVPSHFPTDEYGLSYFDGTHLFEHADPRQGYQPDWNSYIFNNGRPEVRSFLISSAMFWLGVYHADGLRVDAVASMLYLDYSRKPGQWIPNIHGGNENLESIAFLRQLNGEVRKSQPGALMVAEESTAFPRVTHPIEQGGLGFHLKWDMGWMHDTLYYMSQDPLYRKFHQQALTFREMYAYSENFLLSLSHDEVVYGKGSLLRKMPGDEWQKFANLRLLFGYMYSVPGKKLLFMGDEFGQSKEWNHDTSLDWQEAMTGRHGLLQRWVEDLSRFYRDTTALHLSEFNPVGFQWVNADDTTNSVLSYFRRGSGEKDVVLVVCNFTPVTRRNYRVGVPFGGDWEEALNSDATIYGGSNQGNMGTIEAAPVPANGHPNSLNLLLPPLATLYLRPQR